MCMGGGGGGYRPPAKPRWLQDTSNEIVVSKYELSEKNKAKNARIRASLIRRPTIQIDNGGDDHSPDFGSKGGKGKAGDQGIGGIRDAMQDAFDSQTSGKSSAPDTNNDGIGEFSI